MKNKIDPGTLVVAGDGAQQVVLPVAAPSASGSRPGLWPLPPQAGVFWTWERIAVKAQVRRGHVMSTVWLLPPSTSGVLENQH